MVKRICHFIAHYYRSYTLGLVFVYTVKINTFPRGNYHMGIDGERREKVLLQTGTVPGQSATRDSHGLAMLIIAVFIHA